MIYYLGKFLELNGLVILTFGLIRGMRYGDVPGEVRMLAVGVAVFLLGYLLEKKIAPRS